MHRCSNLAMAFTMAALALVPGVGRFGGADTILARVGDMKATPTASSPQVLAESSIATPPTAPVVLGFARLTFAPGAGVADLVVSGPELLYLESGVLTVRIPGELEEGGDVGGLLTRSATPRPAPPVTASPGGLFEFTLYSGDSLMVPSDTPHEIQNREQTPAVVLAAALTPQPAAQTGTTWPPSGSGNPLPSDIDVQSLDVGYASGTDAPHGPSRITLSRLTAADGVLLQRHQAGGPELISVEQGGLDLLVESGEIRFRSSASGDVQTMRRDEGATPAPAVQIPTGGAVLVEPGTIATMRSTGDEPLVALLLTVLPA